MKKMFFILLATVTLISLALVACNQSATPTTTAPATTTAATATTKPPTTNPATAPAATTPAPAPTGDKYGGIWKEALSVGPSRPLGYPAEGIADSFTDASPALERLIGVQLDGTITPALATAWKVADDSKSITLTLRKGVKFSDGSDFNADVCKWNLDLVLAAKQSITNVWKSIDKVDDYTIRINLSSYTNTTLTDLSTGPTSQISKAFVDKNGVEAARWNPIGTGPFIMLEFLRDAKLTYKRNPNYWDATIPYLDGVTMTVIADATVRKLAFQKGDISRLPADGLDAVNLQKAGYPMKTAPGGTFTLIPDSGVAGQPWANVNVRLAASYALDRETLAKGLGFGFLKPAYQLYPSYADTRIPNLVPTTYNPAKAKDLLTQAGYPNGFKTVMHAFVRVIPNDYSTAVAAQLRAVGIDVTTDFPEAGKYDDLRTKGWSDGLLNHALGTGSNHNGAFTSYLGSTQFVSLKRPNGFQQGVDVSLAAKVYDPKLVQAVIQLLYDDMTVIPYLEQTQISFYQKGANDADADTYGLMWPIFKDCWLDKSAR
jgi:peptide/nickel transport system substrate-binding protein